MLKQWLKRKAVVIESSDEEYEPVVANTPVTQPAPKDQTRLQELQPHTAMKGAAAATDSNPSSPVADSRIAPYCHASPGSQQRRQNKVVADVLKWVPIVTAPRSELVCFQGHSSCYGEPCAERELINPYCGQCTCSNPKALQCRARECRSI